MEAMSQIHLETQTMRATVDTLGATLVSLAALVAGQWRDLVLTSLDDPYMGRTVGRVANRLDAGRFSLDGVEHQTTLNEAPNTLHGGVDGFSGRQWQVVATSPTSAAYRLISPDGDQGFPGQVEVAVVFDLGEHVLTVTYAATTDAPTVLNLTLHPYFNLAQDVTPLCFDDHRLQINAATYTPLRPDGIPTGQVSPLAGTGLDFATPRVIGEARANMLAEGLDRGGALDHNFVVPGDGLRQMVKLTGPDGTTLLVLSDAPAVQIYDAAGFNGSLASPDGRPYGPHAGLAIEPQGFPDAPNHNNFPSVELRPGLTWTRTISYAIIG